MRRHNGGHGQSMARAQRFLKDGEVKPDLTTAGVWSVLLLLCSAGLTTATQHQDVAERSAEGEGLRLRK